MLELPQILSSYVPRLIVERVAADPTPLTKPFAERFPAAVLFADISGFTALTERLAQQGPAGAEELSFLLNTYFIHLIDLIIAHGGEIVKFAGDAPIVLWPAKNTTGEDLSTVTRRAAQCALALQAKLNNYEVVEGLNLSLRIGIGAGEVWTAGVGGVRGRWEFLVAGAPVVQMSAAERQAQPGEIVLSPEAWAQIQYFCEGQPLPEGGIRLNIVQEPLLLRSLAPINLAPGSEVALRGYIPAAILSRLDAGQTGWLGELRSVTILFFNITGLDYMAPDALDQVQEVMHNLQTILYNYEGSVNQFIVDDKGTTLVAALGLPPLAHEDDAVRTVQAAMVMQDEIHQFGLQSSAGIATGRVFCGERGSIKRREYGIIGDTINLSARLMQAASNVTSIRSDKTQDKPQRSNGSDYSILCDIATYQAAQPCLTFETLIPITVKGKARPISVFRPMGHVARGPLEKSTQVPPGIDQGRNGGEAPASIYSHQAKMVSRAVERTILMEQLQALLQGVGKVVVIEGEAGIGKSRLIDDLLEYAYASGIRSLVGRGSDIEKLTPYNAWRDIFSQFFGLSTFLEGSEVRSSPVLMQLRENPELLLLAPLLNAILPLDLPENEITAQMAGQIRADNTRDLLLRLLQKAANQAPTMVILEDAQWLDSASWALILSASQHVHPLLLVITTRPMSEPLPAEYSQMLQNPDIQQIRLGALSLQDTITIGCQCLGVQAIPEPVATLIYERAEGHPLFSEELVYALLDAGLIHISNKECHIKGDIQDFRDLNFPYTVQGMITSRIDRLIAPQQLILKVASVIGRTFVVRILQDIYPIQTDKMQLAHHLDVLEKMDLIQRGIPEPNLTYFFKHGITQEVIYNLMLFSQRRALHRAVAEWYERTYINDPVPFYPLLVHHWSKAEEEFRALDYLEKAGEQALRNGAYQEALTFFSEAMSRDTQSGKSPASRKSRVKETIRLSLDQPIVEPQQRWARWERRIGEAYFGLGQLMESREHYERALMLSSWPIPMASGKLVLNILKQILRHLWPKVLDVKKSPIGQGQDRSALLETVCVYEQLVEIYYLLNETIPATSAALHMLDLSERADFSPELARSYASLCVAIGLIPVHALARIYQRRAREIAQSVNDLPTQAFVSMGTSVYDMGIGQWAQAQPILSQGIEVSDRLGDHQRWAENMILLEQVAYYQGMFTDGEKLATDIYTRSYRYGNILHQAWGLSGQGENKLRLGQTDEAIALLEKALALYAETMDRISIITTYGLLAIAHLRRMKDLSPDDRRQAQQAAEMATQMIGQSPPTSYYLLEGYAGIAEVYLALWEAEWISVHKPPNWNSSLHISTKQACKALHKYTRIFPIGQPHAWLWQGLYYWLSGKPSKAYKAWQRSLVAGERLGMLYEQGLTHYEMGRHLEIDSPMRPMHLTRACEIFSQLSAAYDLARAQAVLDRN